MTQRCPRCKNDLLEVDFPPSHWRKKGKQCKKCHVKRQAIRNLRVKYGLTPEDVTTMSERQNGRCLGCQKELPINFVVDHDHASGKVRGLLCRPCNLTLGMVKDDKGILTRLRLYLDRDPNKTNIYVIGSLRNPNIMEISKKLREFGFNVWDEWVAAGPEADDHWQKYEIAKGNTYQEALKGLAAQNVFYFDKSLIDLADVGVLVMPAGKSGHLELGYMSARGKRTYILQDKQPERFDVMPQFATGVFVDIEELVQALGKHL